MSHSQRKREGERGKREGERGKESEGKREVKEWNAGGGDGGRDESSERGKGDSDTEMEEKRGRGRDGKRYGSIVMEWVGGWRERTRERGIEMDGWMRWKGKRRGDKDALGNETAGE